MCSTCCCRFWRTACLTDSQGRRVDFKNTVIIMTSNVGARLITDKQKALGFADRRTRPPRRTGQLKKIRERCAGRAEKGRSVRNSSTVWTTSLSLTSSTQENIRGNCPSDAADALQAPSKDLGIDARACPMRRWRQLPRPGLIRCTVRVRCAVRSSRRLRMCWRRRCLRAASRPETRSVWTMLTVPSHLRPRDARRRRLRRRRKPIRLRPLRIRRPSPRKTNKRSAGPVAHSMCGGAFFATGRGFGARRTVLSGEASLPEIKSMKGF